MKLSLNLIKTFLLWSLITIFLILIVLIPRDFSHQLSPQQQDHFSYRLEWNDYKTSIIDFAQMLWNNKGLGTSEFGMPIEEEVRHYMTRSIVIIIPAFILSIFLGVVKGIYDFKNTNKKTNWLGNGLTWLFQTTPDFFMLIIVQFIFFTLADHGILFVDLYGYEHWYNRFFPTIFLAIYPTVYIARITSTSMSSQVGMDYIRTARSKGISERVILYRHVLRNCMGTILSHFLTVILYILSSLPVIEYLTSYRGAGRRFLQAMKIQTIFTYGSSFDVERNMVIAFIFAFMLIILSVIWISQIARHFLIPKN